MTILEGILAGLIQGLTEFLPVSSSGHLVLFGGKMTLFSEVVFHAATLLAVLAVFFNECRSVFLSPFTAAAEKYRTGSVTATREPLRLLLIIAAASVPAAVAGLLLHGPIESLLASPSRFTVVGLLLFVTGTVLLSTALIRRKGEQAQPGWLQAVAVGTAQAAALLPGISRSGMTISAAVHLGIKREFAGVFSFLLAVPAVGGAALLQLKQVISDPSSVIFLPGYHIAGFLTAFISGVISLKLLLAVVRRGQLHWFGIYCFAVGIFALLR